MRLPIVRLGLSKRCKSQEVEFVIHEPAIFFIRFHVAHAAHRLFASPTQMIALGSDHGGVDLKNHLLEELRAQGIEVCDFGTQGRESVDYPDFASSVARSVAEGRAERGILVCTSGIGMSIVANKFPGVRAALVGDLEGARSSREHNDANILVLGGAKTDAALARQILTTWLTTPFGGGRHQRRIEKIRRMESELGIGLDKVTTEPRK